MTISREEEGERKTFTTHYLYDSSSNITQSTDNAGNVTIYEYDANGSQSAIIDAKGRKITYAYDSMGNMVRTTYPDKWGPGKNPMRVDSHIEGEYMPWN